ncbi:MAG: DUF302 domain-containing protein [Hyphomicrobiales bacterium]|nr:DUF302 domain-containing protein [Hyphomicrobiales bacterium]
MSLMTRMMFVTGRSRFSFDETVEKVIESAKQAGWSVPNTLDLQAHYQSEGHADMTRTTIIYFCYAEGSLRIFEDDDNRPMSVMMPTGVSVHETSTGEVRVSRMDFALMSWMFGGTVKQVMREGAKRMKRTFVDILV